MKVKHNSATGETKITLSWLETRQVSGSAEAAKNLIEAVKTAVEITTKKEPKQ